MTSLDDSGLGSADLTKGGTPVTSKIPKRPLVNASGQSSVASAKKRKLSIARDRSGWTTFELDISSDDFLMKEKIESESVEIEDSKWVLSVNRKRYEESVMMEVSLHCTVPSAAWYAECNIDLEVFSDDIIHTKSFTDCMITSSSVSREYSLDWRKHFLLGGKVSAHLLISRICNKFLSFPDFTNPRETGQDKLMVGDEVIYVDKNLLSLHSKFFARLFSSSGPYRLRCRVEDLVATLRTVYPQKGVVDDTNACTIAAMAKHFEFWETLERCEQHLLNSTAFSTLEKLEISLNCQMHALLSRCSANLKSMEDVMKLVEDQKEGFVASDKTKAHLFDLVLALNQAAPKQHTEVVID